MATELPALINQSVLSHAWGELLLHVLERGTRDLTPVLLSVSRFNNNQPAEDGEIRAALDAALLRDGKCTCSDSALTLFPYKHWLRTGCGDRQALYGWYLKEFLPRVKARNNLNCHGTYFERMIAFTGVKHKSTGDEVTVTNQLEHIICIWHRKRDHPRRPRQSALQVVCFDPAKDHTGQPVRGFPCLQQVSFAYDDSGGLAVNAYYPTQYVFDRAYGNYLGLCHLGHFMAHELGLTLVRFNCFVGHPEIGGNITKGDLAPLARLVARRLQPQESAPPARQ